LELDHVASELVLENIRAAIPSRWKEKVRELQEIAKGDDSITLGRFMEDSGLELDDVYAGGKTWSDLRGDAGLSVQAPGPHEEAFRRACSRLRHVDDLTRLKTYQRVLRHDSPPAIKGLAEHECRLLRMLVATVTEQALDKSTGLADAFKLLWSHGQVRAELAALFEVLEKRIDHLHVPLQQRREIPLQVHAQYSRLEILAAFGVGDKAKVMPWQSGVFPVKDAQTDILAFTLDKTSGGFSPTTRYRDFAISRDLIHWESQSNTRADSEPGRRYQNHVALGTSIMLFARQRRGEPFWFLGPATYVKHESELPMAVTWKLQYPLSGDLFAQFAAAVA